MLRRSDRREAVRRKHPCVTTARADSNCPTYDLLDEEVTRTWTGWLSDVYGHARTGHGPATTPVPSRSRRRLFFPRLPIARGITGPHQPFSQLIRNGIDRSLKSTPP